jgi:hypothetical protein
MQNPFVFRVVELVRNLMAHAQKPDFVFRLNGRVPLNRRGSQFSRLVAAEVCASALVMLDTPRSEVVWEYWLPTPFASFPFTSPPVCHHVPNAVYLSSQVCCWKLNRALCSLWYFRYVYTLFLLQKYLASVQRGSRCTQNLTFFSRTTWKLKFL